MAARCSEEDDPAATIAEHNPRLHDTLRGSGTCTVADETYIGN